MNAPVNSDQIKILHTVKSKLGLDQDTWRDVLSGYNVETSKHLSFHQAAELISRLVNQAVESGVWEKQSQQRYENYRDRRGWATPNQLRMLEGMWSEVSVANTAEDKRKAFEKFVRNHFGIGKPEWIPQYMVVKISFTIKIMKQQRDDKNAKTTDNNQRDLSPADEARSRGEEGGKRDCDRDVQSDSSKDIHVCRECGSAGSH
jgi:hypothetical protein